MTDTIQTKAVEDFLKAVYSLQEDEVRVSTNALAEALSISAPSVTDMARRMVNAGMVDYIKYEGVLLTREGRAIALRVIRRHRLLEAYLVEELGYDLAEVHGEADKLEHAVSDHFIEAIATKLGHPGVDPHGDPIPTPDGIIARQETIALSDLPLKSAATVARFIAPTPEMLKFILERGFKLGVTVEVCARDPFDGPLHIQLADSETVIGHNVASAILVERTEE